MAVFDPCHGQPDDFRDVDDLVDLTPADEDLEDLRTELASDRLPEHDDAHDLLGFWQNYLGEHYQ